METRQSIYLSIFTHIEGVVNRYLGSLDRKIMHMYTVGYGMQWLSHRLPTSIS